MKRRVVITGIGPATAIGIGKKDFFQSIIDMQPKIVPISECYEKNYEFKSRYYVPMPEFKLSNYGIHPSVEGMMEQISRLSVLCTRLALEDAGIPIERDERYFKVQGFEDAAIIIGVGMSSLETALESFMAHISQGNQLENKNTKARYSRMVIPMLMPNAVCAWVSIIFGIKGLQFTLNASCASGSMAIGEAYHNILTGRCDAAITGGVEALTEKNGSIMRGFDVLTALTRSEDGRPMPFSKNRTGFLFNEGAGCILVLEELERAKKRGANIYAEIVGYESLGDAYHIVQMDPSGQSINVLFDKIIKGVSIDYINAHGTGTVSNDEIEAKIIRKVFGPARLQPFINSTKGILGHSIGASGALEAAVTALSVKNSVIHGNLTSDPVEDLNLPVDSFKKDIQYALSASYGFGGHNALLLFKRFDDHV